MHDTVPIEVQLPNGQKEERSTALCCQSICFISLGNITQCVTDHHLELPKSILKGMRFGDL